VQKVGSARADEEWYAFTSATRIVTTGGERLYVYDLDAKQKSAIGEPGEWEGFATVPGDAGRFLVGQDRKGSRDYFWVKLP
jgi:hypothetical protein